MIESERDLTQSKGLPDVNSGSGRQCSLSEDYLRLDSLGKGMRRQLADAGCWLAHSVEDRVQFELLLSELSSQFVNLAADEVDSQIDSSLRRIVECLGIDRSGFGEVSADGRRFNVTHSYQLPGVPPSPKLNLHSLFPCYAEMIRQNKIVRIPEDLPADAIAEREYCRRVGLKYNLTIPLAVKGSVVGGIGFASFHSQRQLPDEIVPRLRLLGDVFTNALIRKRSDEALRRNEQLLRNSKKQLRDLAAKLLHAQEQERRRIAREMHDDWTQRLAVLGIDVAKLERHLGSSEVAMGLLEAIRGEIVSLSEDVHGLSRQLHPAILDDLGLVEALRSECASFSRREDLRVSYFPQDVPLHIPTEIALCAYRIAQESLRNVAKHSGALEASVMLFVAGQRKLVLQIQDRGSGFDPTANHTGPGLGLSSMDERVNLVQGTFSITSAPGEGTSVEVRLPLPEAHSMNKPRVLIADDHRILAEGVRSLLEQEFEVLGIVADGRELVSTAKASQPDVIVADITMPSLNGIEAAGQLRDAGVTSKVVFLTQHRDVAYARRALEVGAAGFVLKHSVASELITAIREALRGQTYITPTIAGELVNSYRNGGADANGSPERLTARQREVLQLVAEGRSAKEVAAVLKISTRTAEAHKARILEVLGLQSTAELVQYAIRNGIISV